MKNIADTDPSLEYGTCSDVSEIRSTSVGWLNSYLLGWKNISQTGCQGRFGSISSAILPQLVDIGHRVVP